MDAPFTLDFETFWNWLEAHPNCIVRGGTADTVIYDDEDLHWHFAREKEGVRLVQVIRGKRLMGEIFVESERVAYAQAVSSENQEEHSFELISETESERVVAYFFVLAHAYEDDRPLGRGRVH